MSGPATPNFWAEHPDLLPSQATLETLAREAKARGVSVDTLVRVSLSNLRPPGAIFSRGTMMGFGKYATETVETVIRCDPAYATWAWESVERFQLDDEAAALLAAVRRGDPA